MKREPNLKAGQAVLLGHLVVNVPVLTIIGLAYLIGYISIGPDRAIFCVPVGAVMAWAWWSAMVPRWREWVKNQGADEVRTQHLAQVGPFSKRQNFVCENAAELRILRGAAEKLPPQKFAAMKSRQDDLYERFSRVV